MACVTLSVQKLRKDKLLVSGWLSSEETSSWSWISFSYFDRSSAGALTNGGDVPCNKAAVAVEVSTSGEETSLLDFTQWSGRRQPEHTELSHYTKQYVRIALFWFNIFKYCYCTKQYVHITLLWFNILKYCYCTKQYVRITLFWFNIFKYCYCTKQYVNIRLFWFNIFNYCYCTKQYVCITLF